MNDPNQMTAQIIIDDSQEEEVSQRHGKRMAGMQASAEGSAKAQTRAWETSHERIVALMERTEQRHTRMSNAVIAMTQATERGFSAAAAGAEKLALRTGALVTAIGALALTAKAAFAGLAAGTVAVGEHSVAVSKLVDAYRAIRLILSPTLFTAGTIGAGIAVEAAIRAAQAQASENRTVGFLAARGGGSFTDVASVRNAARITGYSDFGDIFAGKGAAQIAEIVAAYSKLQDPLAKANLLVKEFGANAERAMPMLTKGLRENIDDAYRLAAAMNSADRESLERFSENMGAIGRKMHEAATGFRAAWESASQWFALIAAHTSDTIGVGQAPDARLVLGLDAPPAVKVPTDAEFVAGANSAARDRQRELATSGTASAADAGTRARSQAALGKYDVSAEGLSRRLSSAQERLANFRGQLGTVSGGPLEQTVREQILQTEASIESLRPQVEAARKAERFAQETAELRKRGVGFVTIGDTIIKQDEINRANPSFSTGARSLDEERQARIAAAARVEQSYSTAGQFQYEGGGVTSLSGVATVPGGREDYESLPSTIAARLKGLADEQKAADVEHLEHVNAETSATQRIIELRAGAGGEFETAQKVANLREDALKEELKVTGDIAKYRVDSERNALELQIKAAEVDKQHLDEVKRSLSGLIDNLTGGKGFGQALSGAARSLLLAPIKDSVSSFGARALAPLLYGLAGGPVSAAAGSGGNGNAGTGPYGSVWGAGDWGFGMGAGNGFGLEQSSAITPPFAGGWSGQSSQGSGGLFGGILGKLNGGGSGSGLSGIWSSLKGSWGGLTRADAGGTPGVDGQPGTDEGNTGAITGANGLLGAGLLLGGSMLAQRGLLGKDRGTWGGAAEGALGGALIGFKFGGPLGALIGGAAGGLIGIGEKIAGVETPEREAARLIKSIYGLNIDANSTTIQQIVGLAKQSFGGSVSIAVRSPQVRELLQLYADSTGQKSSVLLAQQVHSASLAESGGSLFQQATYQNGTPYTYASNLPTLGPSGGLLPTSNPMTAGVTVNISPQATVDLWRMGTAQAIAGDPRGVAQANVNGSGQSSARLSNANLQLSPSTILS